MELPQGHTRGDRQCSGNKAPIGAAASVPEGYCLGIEAGVFSVINPGNDSTRAAIATNGWIGRTKTHPESLVLGAETIDEATYQSPVVDDRDGTKGDAECSQQ